MPSWQRADHEYSSGAWGTVEYPGRSGLLPLGRFRFATCAGSDRRCATHSFTLGQLLYTGEAPPSPGVAPPAHPSLRPNAAWLYVEAAERDSVGATIDEYRLAVGVVGPPALGGPLQRFFHFIGPLYPRPVDWSRQLPFEPGFIASMERTRIVSAFGDSTHVNGAFLARGGASIGTILTGVTAGGSASVSIPLRGAPESGYWPTVVFSADVAVHGVLRDESLDGTLFRSSDHVEKNWVYDQERASLALRWSRITVAYRATRAGLQYRLQQAPTAWGTLAAEIRLGR